RWSNGRHTMCGRVKQRSTRRHAEGDGITPRRGLIRIDVCGPGEGSSGGPLYKNHTGYGLFVLYSDGVCHKYFTRLDFAESALHVHVVPE
ncbi:MAG TPA: hypothetical protein VFZ00_10190, partial [Solirubrobacter sp.]|nr:hypothetical protein [Solirubrobacter sp.]